MLQNIVIMEDHIMDPDDAGKLEKESRYRSVSKEEILEHIETGDTVADIGSGTGFFTDDMAQVAEKVYAIDFQEKMHEYYKSKGLPENVQTVTSKASELDIENVDVIVSLFSLHEIDIEKSIGRFEQILKPGGKLVIFDWSSEGSGYQGPPLEKRLNAEKAHQEVSKELKVLEATERKETFKLVGLKK